MRIVRRIGIGLVVLAVLAFSFLFIYLKSGGHDAAILMYHSVGDRQSSSLNVSVATFEKNLAFLKKHRYKVITLGALADLLRSGQKVPPKTVVITFDDGYENNYTLAYPLLKKYGFPATIFVISGFVGGEHETYGQKMKFATAQMLREMVESGFVEIGAHSRRHPYLPEIEDQQELLQEVVGSRNDLEAMIGRSVDVFCYPVGGYNDRVVAAVKAAGYKAAVTILLRHNGFVHKDIYALKRIKVSEKCRDPVVFGAIVSGYYLRFKEMT